MEIVKAFPPNIDRICAVLGDRPRYLKGVVFSYGAKLYNPWGGQLAAPILAHECAHGERQGEHPETWWSLYLSDPQFRLIEELEGHRAEYRSFCQFTRSREQRARYLAEVARKLAGPLYGGLISELDARKGIQG